MNYYERHIGDYLKDTSHLSLLEHGIYTRLMDVYYTREEPIPADDAARLIGARSKEEREALAAVLREFFVPDQEPATAWLQHRCEREIARLKDKRSKAKRSADARWNAQRSQCDRNADAYADAMRTHSECNARAPVPNHQTPITNHHTPLPPKGDSDPEGFAEFWSSWPSSPRKQDRKKCAEKWRRNRFAQQLPAILAHVEAMKQTKQWRDGYEPAPLTYLNGERWGDGMPAGDAAAELALFADAR